MTTPEAPASGAPAIGTTVRLASGHTPGLAARGAAPASVAAVLGGPREAPWPLFDAALRLPSGETLATRVWQDDAGAWRWTGQGTAWSAPRDA